MTARDDLAELIESTFYGPEDKAHWGDIADAVLAAGWRPPECPHVWMSVKLDQTQACSLCGESRRHFCTFHCPAPHERPFDEMGKW